MTTRFHAVTQTSADLGLKNTDNLRTNSYVYTKISEEFHELHEEILVQQGFLNQPQGKDGIFGEAMDLLISAIDLFALNTQNDKTPTEVETLLFKHISHKLDKNVESLDGLLTYLNLEHIGKDASFNMLSMTMNKVCVGYQIDDGISYKKQEKSVFLDNIAQLCIDSLAVYVSYTKTAPQDQVYEIVNIIVSKTNKWRKNRSLTQFKVK